MAAASMADCKKIQSQIGEYIDGALAPDAAWSVRLHLGSCAVCTRVADELRGTVSLLQTMPRQEISNAFEARLARRLADVALQPRRTTLVDRLRDWWAVPPVRPATLAVAGALAATIPAALFFRAQSGEPGSSSATKIVARPPLPPPTSASQQLVQHALVEHSLDAGADPLGDQNAVILASTSGGGSFRAEETAR
jgi:anti-sigma factor RsiW